MKQLTVVLFCIAYTVTALTASDPLKARNPPPKDGYVPDAQTAQRIAEAVLAPIFGTELVEAQKPYTVRKGSSDTWIVEGASIVSKTHPHFGGQLWVQISKKDGAIVDVIRWK